MTSLKKIISRSLINLPGWHTNRKIVVIESDDWGSIRMPSKEVYEKLLEKCIRVDKCPYNQYDSLASEDDLNALFNVLIKFKDRNGNHPVITANTVVANPDFDKISQSDFKEYFFEPFTETLKKYPAHHNSFELWKQGMKEKLFHPQFHGREHVNIPMWMKLLQNNNSAFRMAFDNNFWGIGPSILNSGKINIQASFDAESITEILNQRRIIEEGVSLFRKIFGYKPKSFIANNFIWDESLNVILKVNGVDILQGMKYQKRPLLNETKHPLIRHYTGQKLKEQVYLVRNCAFEPTLHPNIDSVSNCMYEISNAFYWKTPALISSHRLNFIGFINDNNRTQNLKELDILLRLMLKKWPDIEFLTSVELGKTILSNK